MENNNLLNKNQLPKIFWDKIQNEMKEKFGKDIFDSWLKKINFVEEFNNYILLSVPTRFIRDWITSRYLDQILQIVKKFKKEIIRIEFVILKTSEDKSFNKVVQNGKDKFENISFIKDTYLQYNRIDPNKTFENFIVGNSNKLAFEASNKVTQEIAHYNPLYIYGGVGMGKTHLLNSIGLKLKNSNNIFFVNFNYL